MAWDLFTKKSSKLEAEFILTTTELLELYQHGAKIKTELETRWMTTR